MALLDPRYLVLNKGYYMNPNYSLQDRLQINTAVARKVMGDIVNRAFVYASVLTRPSSVSSRSYSSTRGVLISDDELSKAKPDMKKAYYFQFNPSEIQDVKETIYEVRPYAGLSYNDFIWGGGGERNISFQLFLDNTPGSKTSFFRPKSYNSELANKPDTKSSVSIKSATLTDIKLNIPPRFSYSGQAFSNTRVHKRGVLPEVELVQSFLYPAPMKEDNPQIPRFSEGGIVSFNQFRPPAIAVLSIGPIFLQGIVKSASVTYTLFDEDLTPIRATIDVEFSVFEYENLTPKTPWRTSR